MIIGVLILTLTKQSLQPAQAVVLLEDRVKLIGKINSDIADWLSVCFSYTIKVGVIGAAVANV